VACGFDFGKTYGVVGQDFIEMHHDRPLSSFTRRQRVHPTELTPLCANCHRIVHREVPFLSIRQLRRIMRDA
jgi:5-methylcytosine-specific restriction protein A